jgi:hypothetical protein
VSEHCYLYYIRFIFRLFQLAGFRHQGARCCVLFVSDDSSQLRFLMVFLWRWHVRVELWIGVELSVMCPALVCSSNGLLLCCSCGVVVYWLSVVIARGCVLQLAVVGQ